MFIFFRCSRCKNALSVESRKASKPTLCPLCKAEIIVPSSSDIAPSRTAPVEAILVPTVQPLAIPEPVVAHAEPKHSKPPYVNLPLQRYWKLGLAACAVAMFFFVACACSAAFAWSKWRQRSAIETEVICETLEKDCPLDDGNLPEGRRTDASAEDLNRRESTDLGDWQVLPSLARLSSQQIEEEEGTKGTTAQPGGQKMKSLPSTNGKIVVKRRKELSEEDLRKQLLWAPEVGLAPQDVPPIIHEYMANLQGALLGTEELCQEPTFILQQRPDLKALPIRRGRESRLDANATLQLHVLSKELHVLLDKLAAKNGDGGRPMPVVLAEFMKQQTRGKQPEWLRPEAIPTLLQIMMTDDQPVRLLLVQLLTLIEGKQASTALAQRAVFDLSQEVREAAVQALIERPRVEFRPILVEALRYPWAPAADHAAEALVALEDRDAASLLVRLLREPDPSAPVDKSFHHYKREIVRLKHVDNCLTCHPPAIDGSDPIQGTVPGFNFFKVSVKQESSNSTGSSSPTGGGGGGGGGSPTGGGGSTGGGGYGGGGGSSSGSSGGSSGSSSAVQIAVPGKPGRTQTVLVSRPGTKTTVNKKEIPLTIRADITYLRQDFSILQPVVQTDLSRPEQLRFDYVIRLRPLTEKQMKEWKSRPEGPGGYEQRDAVLFALRELTGQDPGSTWEAWDKIYPSAEFDSRAAELTTRLVEAPDYRKDAVIKELKESKGVVYSQALAQAIPQLTGNVQEKARAALVERMKRMTATTLRNKLLDEDREIRYAAAVACRSKLDKALVRDLNNLLDDSEPIIAEAAQKSIQSLGGSPAARELSSDGGAD